MRSHVTICCLVLSHVATPLWAQNNHKPPHSAPEELETITIVGTRTERALDEVAATIMVKTADDLEQELVRDIADLVRFEPGISVGGTGSRFGLGGFNIRGIGGNRVLTLVDGIRVPEAFSFGPFLSARRDFVDIDSLGRAEIARGPISSLYGSDALGGVVALSTKQPWDYLQPKEPFYSGLKLGYSGADSSTVGTLTLAGGNDEFSALLMYTRRDAEETENAGRAGGTGPTRQLADPQDIGVDNISAKLSWAPTDAHLLTLALEDYANDTDTRILSDYGSVNFGTTVDRRDALDERQRQRFSLSYRYDSTLFLADEIRATIYRQSSDSKQFTSEDRTSASGAQQFRQRHSVFEQDIDGLSVQAGKRTDLAASTHYLSFGLDHYRTDNTSIRDGGTFDANGTKLPEFTILPTRDFPITEVRQSALFVQDEIALFDGRLTLSPGLRYDRFDADTQADPIYLGGNPGSPLPEDYKDSELTAKIGLVYRLTDRWSTFARFSEGFRAPPYDDVNVGFTNLAGGYKTIANTDLDSETSEGFEWGLRWQSASAELALSAFHNDYQDFIESFALAPQFAANGGIDPADGLLTFQSINREGVEIEGLELSGGVDLDVWNDALADFELRFSAAYARGEDNSSKQALNSIEPLNGVLGLRYSPPNGRWGADLIWTLAQGKDQDDIDADNPRLAPPGYGVLDLLAHIQINPRVRLNLGLFNLTNKDYIRWVDSGGIGQDAPARFTQPDFNAGATLRIEL